MFNLNDSMRYYLYPYPTDMRKSFYTLSGVVKDLMGHDVRNGDIFIFVGQYENPTYGMRRFGNLSFASGGGAIQTTCF